MEKKPFFGHKNFIHFFKVPKIKFLPKGLTHHFVQKCYFFLYLFLVKIRGGMSLRNGMWHGLRSDIIMWNVIYVE